MNCVHVLRQISTVPYKQSESNFTVFTVIQLTAQLICKYNTVEAISRLWSSKYAEVYCIKMRLLRESGQGANNCVFAQWV